MVLLSIQNMLKQMGKIVIAILRTKILLIWTNADVVFMKP